MGELLMGEAVRAGREGVHVSCGGAVARVCREDSGAAQQRGMERTPHVRAGNGKASITASETCVETRSRTRKLAG